VTKETTLLVTTQKEIAAASAEVVKAQELKETCTIVSEDVSTNQTTNIYIFVVPCSVRRC